MSPTRKDQNDSRQKSVLQRLYLSRLTLLSLVTATVGLTILIYVNLPGNILLEGFLKSIPFKDIGSAFLSTSIIIIAFEYFYRNETEMRTDERFRKFLPAQTDAVMSDFYGRIGSGDQLTFTSLSNTAIDNIVVSSLSARLGEADLAREVYADLRNQVVRSVERWRNFQVSIDLSRYEQPPQTGWGSLLKATFRCEYTTTVLDSDEFRFTCVSDPSEYRRLLRDPKSTLEWYFEPVGALGAESRETFSLLYFSINGKSQKIRRIERAKSQTFLVDTANVKDLAGQNIYISYAYSVLVQRNSHLMLIDVSQPARGLRIELSYSGCGIHFVNVLDFIASASEPRILRTPEPAPSIVFSFDGWAFPKSGVAFVWVLEEEL